MRVRRVYVDAPLATGTRVTLQGAAASHVTRVLRLRVGEALTVFNGSGGEYAASIEHARGGTVAVAIGEARARERESPLTLTRAQGDSRDRARVAPHPHPRAGRVTWGAHGPGGAEGDRARGVRPGAGARSTQRGAAHGPAGRTQTQSLACHRHRRQ